MFRHLTYFVRETDIRITGLLFALNSFAFGNWVTRIPDIKQTLGLSDGELGFALLGAPLGSVITMPFVNWITSKLQLGKATLLSACLLFISLSFIPFSNSQLSLFIMLFAFGITMAIMDVGMNAIAVIAERRHKKHIMSTCHGMWSLGAMIGSAFGSLMLGLSVPVANHMIIATVIMISILIFISRNVIAIQETNDSKQSVFTIPNGKILILSIIGFFILLSEGAISDWSAVYMREVLNSPDFWVGMAFSGYAGLMAVGRFSGDSVIPRMGKKFVVVVGGLLSGCALLLALVTTSTLLAIIVLFQ
jgi:MFS family permease